MYYFVPREEINGWIFITTGNEMLRRRKVLRHFLSQLELIWLVRDPQPSHSLIEDVLYLIANRKPGLMLAGWA